MGDYVEWHHCHHFFLFVSSSSLWLYFGTNNLLPLSFTQYNYLISFRLIELMISPQQNDVFIFFVRQLALVFNNNS